MDLRSFEALLDQAFAKCKVQFDEDQKAITISALDRKAIHGSGWWLETKVACEQAIESWQFALLGEAERALPALRRHFAAEELRVSLKRLLLDRLRAFIEEQEEFLRRNAKGRVPAEKARFEKDRLLAALEAEMEILLTPSRPIGF